MMRKDSMARELTIEVIIGVFMVVILLGLGYFTIILSKETWFGTRYRIEVLFQEVMGLRDGDNVMVRGMPVGKVERLELKDDGVHVFALLDQQVNLHEDYNISVIIASILGGRYLSIDEGTEKKDIIDSTQLLKGEPPYDLVADAAELVNSVKSGIVEGGIVTNLQAAAEGLRRITDSVNSGEGLIGRLLSTDDTLYNDISAAAESLKNIAAKIENGEGALGKLVSGDDALYEDISATAASLKNITEKIEKGEGTLGKLVSDEDMYAELEKMMKEIRAGIEDMRETAPVVTFTSVFFGAL